MRGPAISWLRPTDSDLLDPTHRSLSIHTLRCNETGRNAEHPPHPPNKSVIASTQVAVLPEKQWKDDRLTDEILGSRCLITVSPYRAVANCCQRAQTIRHPSDADRRTAIQARHLAAPGWPELCRSEAGDMARDDQL